jgi:EPS-associated MarR family transcriptional regulator
VLEFYVVHNLNAARYCLANPRDFHADPCGSLPGLKLISVTDTMPNQDIQLKVLKLLEHNPHLSQRELSAELGVSLGKTHYVLKALVDLGWVKLDNFRRSDNKLGYAYLLTPKGVAEKAKITVSFLARKQVEYGLLREEIERLKAEVVGKDAGSEE